MEIEGKHTSSDMVSLLKNTKSLLIYHTFFRLVTIWSPLGKRLACDLFPVRKKAEKKKNIEQSERRNAKLKNSESEAIRSGGGAC